MNARNEGLAAPEAGAHLVATRYRAIPLATRSFGRLNERNQVAFNESLGEGRFAGKFYDGRRIRSLGTLGGDSTLVTSVNNFEQVTGESRVDTSERVHAFRWSPARGMEDLGTIRNGDQSQGSDINDMGEVAGTVSFADDRPVRAVLWRPGERGQDLGLNRGVSAQLRINNRGQVAGTAIDAEGLGQVFRWSRQGGVVLLEDPDVVSAEAREMNALGQVVGSYSSTDGSGLNPFLWTPGSEFLRLSTRPAFPFDLNENGMVVGVLLDQVAFVWTRDTGLLEIGSLGGGFSNAYGVNNQGIVVGQAATADSLHAFLWTLEGGMIDLNDRLIPQSSNIELGIAFQINDRGAILAATADSTLVLLLPFPGN